MVVHGTWTVASVGQDHPNPVSNHLVKATTETKGPRAGGDLDIVAVIDRDADVVVERQPESEQVHAIAALGPSQRTGREKTRTGRDDVHLDARRRKPCMLTLAAALSAGQSCQACRVILESD